MAAIPTTARDEEWRWRELLERDPRSFDAATHLCAILRNRRELVEALQFAESAIQLDPMRMEGHLHLGLCLLMQERFAEALSSFDTSASLQPQFGLIHYNRGLALHRLGRAEEAVNAVENAIRLEPTNLQFRMGLANLLLLTGDVWQAKQLTERILEVAPKLGSAHELLAKALSALREYGAAESHMNKAVECDPTSAPAWTALGFRRLQKGEATNALECFTRAIELRPSQGLAYYGATQATKLASVDDPLFRKMTSAQDAPGLPNEELSFLHFALGKAWDDLKQYDNASRHFDEAHRFALRNGGVTGCFDRKTHSQEVDATISKNGRSLLTSVKDASSDSDLPILIVGMMRSGTTLLEQILSSHPEVGAGGEQPFWDLVDLDRMGSARARSVAQDYCNILSRTAPGRARVTDKLPRNYLRLGPIHLALPNAHIIHMRRDPRDTCLSIYTTPNAAGPPYIHSFEDITFVYGEYLRLMAHWRLMLPPDKLLEVGYEDLVANPENWIRTVLEFCGLAWNGACLHPERNSKPVHTPSLWQVREPIHAGSIGRWKRYRPFWPWLDELHP